MCREGGGKGSPGVITLMYPGPYRPLYLWGWLVGGVQRTALCQGGVLAARWSPGSSSGQGSQASSGECVI
jgi:hypothetical protein